jgi:hypothetical protein
MLIFYIDESGETALSRTQKNGVWVLNPGVSPWFILAACGIAETSRVDLAHQVMHIKDNFFPGWKAQPWRETELKGRFLCAAHRRLSRGKIPLKPVGYKSLRSIRQLENLCEALGRLLRKFRPLMYVIAVDKTTLVRRTTPLPPEGIAYAFLEQRLALLVDTVYGDAEGALMVADQQHSHEKLFRSGEMLRIRTQVTQNLPIQPNFELILDRPVWIDEILHPLDREILQLPDLAATSVAELVQSGKAPTGAQHMWEDIRACLPAHWGTGLIPDGGMSIYPRPGAYPTGV